jgi:hypothetical protein
MLYKEMNEALLTTNITNSSNAKATESKKDDKKIK